MKKKGINQAKTKKREIGEERGKLSLQNVYKYSVENHFVSKIVKMTTPRKKLVPYSPPPVRARSLEDHDSEEESAVVHASGGEEAVPPIDQVLPLGIDADAM